MNFAFHVIQTSGMYLFSSNILSECRDFAKAHTQVRIVDMFGQVWGSS